MDTGETSQPSISTPACSIGLWLICVVMLAVFVWQSIDPSVVTESLTAYRSALYLQPWRAITSAFVHQGAAHAMFNLVTFAIAAHRTCQLYGAKWLAISFFASVFVGQVAHTLITAGYVVGISGGVCGLYGFLLCREWRGSLAKTIRTWAFFWLYPLTLISLFVIDFFGFLNVADLNHLVGIGTGVLVALGAKSFCYKLPILLTVTVSFLLVAFRPWDPVWHAVHGAYDRSLLIPVMPCAPATGLSEESIRHVSDTDITIINPDGRHIVLSYFNSKGNLVKELDFAIKARSFKPLQGSIWRLETGKGECLGQFTALRSGVVALGAYELESETGRKAGKLGAPQGVRIASSDPNQTCRARHFPFLDEAGPG